MWYETASYIIGIGADDGAMKHFLLNPPWRLLWYSWYLSRSNRDQPSCRYASVRTNLPREIMSFMDWPFVRSGLEHIPKCPIYLSPWDDPHFGSCWINSCLKKEFKLSVKVVSEVCSARTVLWHVISLAQQNFQQKDSQLCCIHHLPVS